MSGCLPFGARCMHAALAAGLVMTLLHALGASRGLALGALAATAALSVVAVRRTRWTAAAPSRHEVVLAAALAAPVLAAAVYTLAQPVHTWDATVIWYGKARALLDWRPPVDVPWPAYPNLGAMLWALLLGVTGPADEPVARLIFLGLYAAWIATAVSLVARPLTWPVVAVSALVVFTLFEYRHVTSGYQDTVVMSVAGVAAALFARTLIDHEAAAPRTVVTAALFAAGALGLIKLEGLFVGVILAGGWLIAARAQSGGAGLSRRVTAAGLALFVGLIAAWPLLTRFNGIDLQAAQGSGFLPLAIGDLPSRLTRLPAIAMGFMRLGPWFALPVAAALVLSVAAWRDAPHLRVFLAWAWGCMTVHAVFVTATFVMTNYDIEWQMRTALDRLIAQQSCLWLLVILVSATTLTRRLRPPDPAVSS